MIYDDVRYVKHSGAQIAYAVVEANGLTGPSVCLIASTGRGPEDFFELSHALAKAGLRVLLPWPRGAGGSTGPIEEIDFHDLASDVASVIEAETNIDGCIVTGHAYGCWIARTLAQDRPDLVQGLILLAAGAGKWPEELSQAINIAMSSEETEQSRRAALQLAFFAPGHDPKPYLTGWSGELVRTQRAARARTDRDSWWPSGSAPILDLVGLQDPFRSESARHFYEDEFPGRVTLVTFNGASHALPDELPEQVAREMVRWVRVFPKQSSIHKNFVNQL